MKKIFYNSWLARKFLWANYTTITLAAFVCTKYKTKEEMTQKVRNHECVHARQWVEIAFVMGAVIWALTLFFDISQLWYLLAFVGFYIIYLTEWLILLFKYGRKAYKYISFEIEARKAEQDSNYLENGDYFEWLQYVFKK